LQKGQRSSIRIRHRTRTCVPDPDTTSLSLLQTVVAGQEGCGSTGRVLACNKIALPGRKGYVHIMTTVQEIERAIEGLSGDQFSQIHDWIVEKDWEKWDAQIERDSAAGKLDFLIDEAQRDAKSGDTRPL